MPGCQAHSASCIAFCRALHGAANTSMADFVCLAASHVRVNAVCCHHAWRSSTLLRGGALCRGMFNDQLIGKMKRGAPPVFSRSPIPAAIAHCMPIHALNSAICQHLTAAFLNAGVPDTGKFWPGLQARTWSTMRAERSATQTRWCARWAPAS